MKGVLGVHLGSEREPSRLTELQPFVPVEDVPRIHGPVDRQDPVQVVDLVLQKFS